MSGGGPIDVDQAARWRRARRDVARRLHPDLGGDIEDYLSALGAVDLRFGVAGPTGAPATSRAPGGRGVILARLARAQVRRARRAVRAVRGALPRRVPGARRYIDL